MTEKRFKIVNDCGDYHLMNGDEQLGYDLCSYSMRKANWNNVVDLLNEQDTTIKRLKEIREEQIETILKLKRKIQELETENKQLIKEWFESEKGYIIESYHDNAIRRDEKIQFLKEEFKERFGDGE